MNRDEFQVTSIKTATRIWSNREYRALRGLEYRERLHYHSAIARYESPVHDVACYACLSNAVQTNIINFILYDHICCCCEENQCHAERFPLRMARSALRANLRMYPPKVSKTRDVHKSWQIYEPYESLSLPYDSYVSRASVQTKIHYRIPAHTSVSREYSREIHVHECASVSNT